MCALDRSPRGRGRAWRARKCHTGKERGNVRRKGGAGKGKRNQNPLPRPESDAAGGKGTKTPEAPLKDIAVSAETPRAL